MYHHVVTSISSLDLVTAQTSLRFIVIGILPWMCFPCQFTIEGSKDLSQRIAFARHQIALELLTTHSLAWRPTDPTEHVANSYSHQR